MCVKLDLSVHLYMVIKIFYGTCQHSHAHTYYLRSTDLLDIRGFQSDAVQRKLVEVWYVHVWIVPSHVIPTCRN